MTANIENMAPNSVTGWQRRAELEAVSMGLPAKCGRVCFWGIVLDIVLDWPESRFLDWSRQVRRVYGEDALNVYDKLQRIYNVSSRDALDEVCLRVMASIPGEVMAKYCVGDCSE